MIKRLFAVWFVCIFAITAFMIPVSASSADVSYTIAQIDDETVEFSGEVIGKQSRELLIRVDYSDTAFDSTSEDITDIIAYQQQVETDDNNKFSVKFKLKDMSAEPENGCQFTIRLGVINTDLVKEIPFTFYGKEYRKKAFEDMEAAFKSGSAVDFATVLEKYYLKLSLNAVHYDTYISAGGDIESVAEFFVNNKEPLANLDDVKERLNIATMLNEIYSTNSYSDFIAAAQNADRKYIKIADLSTFATYKKLSESQKEAIFAMVKADKQYTTESYENSFSVKVLDNAVKNCFDGGTIKTIISENASLLGIDMNNYNKLSNESYMRLQLSPINELSDIKTRLDALINDLSEENSETTNGNSKGSGGKRNGNSVSPVIPAVDIPTEQIEYLPFDDMKNCEWAKEAVYKLYSAGVVRGVSDTKFEPDRNVTREEFVRLLVTGFNLTYTDDSDVMFADVKKDDWYYDYVRIAANLGVINGKDNGNFGIGEPITRQDMAVMISRTFKLILPQLTQTVTDCNFIDKNEIADYALQAVAFVQNTKISTGIGNGAFAPKDLATRAQCALIISKSIDLRDNNMK